MFLLDGHVYVVHLARRAVERIVSDCFDTCFILVET